MSKQMIRPDDFYDMVEAVEAGRATEVKCQMSKYVRDEMFLESVNRTQVQFAMLDARFDMRKVEIHVSEGGVLTVHKARTLPKYDSKITDLGGLDDV